MPFLRFEGLALAGAAIVVLFFLGHARAATAIGLAIVLGLAIDEGVMRHLGLPFLPSSVLLKSKSAADVTGGLGLAGVVGSLAANVVMALHHRWGIVFAVLLCVVAAQARVVLASPRTARAVTIVLLLAGLGAHLMAGQYGWFHRYEVYVVAMLMVGFPCVFGRDLFRFGVLQTLPGKVVLLALSALLVEPYAEAAVLTPLASRNVYEQQFQMHRFATDYFPHRVAVNDLGWVSFQNTSFVLDLWGLGSEPVRKVRVVRTVDKSDIERWSQAADVDFAMVYKAWFADAIPDSWCLVAVLHTEQVTAADANVLFFATKPSVQAEMRDAVQRFAPTLPAHATLTPAAPCS